MRVVVGATMGLLAVVLVLVSMFTVGWYKVSYEEVIPGEELDLEFNMGLSKVRAGITGETEEEEYEDNTAMKEVGSTTMVLLVVGLVFAIMFLILGSIGALGVGGDTMHIVPMLTGLVAGVILLVATVYFAAAFPDAFDEDTGVTAEDIQLDRTVSYSFLMALFGAILCLLGGVMTFQRLSPVPAMPPPGMYGAVPPQYPGQYTWQPGQQPPQQYPGQSPGQYPGGPPQQPPRQYPPQY